MGIRLLRGFVAGWIVYMTVFIVTSYDGLPSILLQPVVAAMFAGAFALAAELAGRLLRSTPLMAAWERLGRWTLLFAALGLALLLFSGPLGLSRTVDPGIVGERSYEVMPAHLAAVAYLLCIFPFVNLPGRR